MFSEIHCVSVDVDVPHSSDYKLHGSGSCHVTKPLRDGQALREHAHCVPVEFSTAHCERAFFLFPPVFRQ